MTLAHLGRTYTLVDYDSAAGDWMMKRVRSFFAAATGRRRLEREMAEEWQHHIESRADALVESGLDRESGLRQARREFGDPLRWVEQGREARGLGWLLDITADATYALRQWRRTPLFALTAILTIALGIGASTAVFSVVDAVVLRNLPFPESDRLVAVGRSAGGDPMGTLAPTDIEEFRRWRETSGPFDGIAAMTSELLPHRVSGNPPEELRVMRVSGEFFDLLGVRPQLGRGFALADEDESEGAVVLISDGFWRSHFAAARDVLGRTLFVGGVVREVVGVMPHGISYPVFADRISQLTDLWIPLSPLPTARLRLARSIDLCIGRLKTGVTPEAAAAQMDHLFPATEREQSWYLGYQAGVAAAKALGGAAKGVTPEARPLKAAVAPLVEHLVGVRTRSWMWLLLGAVTLVLLIVCANVAGLLLARTAARQHEIGIRGAIGASRWRIVRQLLVESLVLSVAGAVSGLALAWYAVEGLRLSMPANIPRIEGIALDVRVLTVAILASITTGLMFGMFPAWQGSRVDLTRTLGDGARTLTPTRGHRQLRSLLVTFELALAVVLLVGAGLFVGSFINLMRVDLGFDPDGLLTAGVEMGNRAPANQRPAVLLDVLGRVQQIPGVEVAAAVSDTAFPVSGRMSLRTVGRNSRIESNSQPPRAYIVSQVTADFHRLFRIPLLNGRYFEPDDIAGRRLVAILSADAAREYFPDRDAIGQRIDLDPPRTVVGVVADLRGDRERTSLGHVVYLPLTEPDDEAHLVLRTSGDPVAIVPALRAVVHSVVPDAPMRDVRLVSSIVSGWDAQRRLTMVLLAAFGGLGLVIAVVGVYGLTAYVVTQRTHEVGVRMALGATRAQIMAMFLRSACWMTLAGLALGTLAAWWFSSAATAFLFELEPTDPRIFALALATLACAALIAAVIPARRAATIDPMIALRN